MNNLMMAEEAFDAVLKKYSFQTVLDLGCGQGLHSQAFRQHLKSVVGIDASTHWGVPDILGEFCTTEFEEQFDLVWCSHTLEHQVNVNIFLQKIFSVLKPGGILAITVPPAKPNIVGGHVTTWNAGMLLYNLILAGFDCRHAMIKQYDYNISIIVRKSRAILPPLRMDNGDIEVLSHYFPFDARQDFNGDIRELQWDLTPDQQPPASRMFTAADLDIADFKTLPPHANDLDNLLWSLQCIELDGDIAEFGVFQGRSLRAMAEQQPLRMFHGFDSFCGLPEDWVRSNESTYSKGHFNTGKLPTIDLPNVKLHPGFFDQSLPGIKQSLSQPLAMIHIDADLYSSAIYVLNTLNQHIVPGTIIVFDELCDWKDSGVYPKWGEGEWKALLEWMQTHNRAVRLLSTGSDYSATIVVAR